MELNRSTLSVCGERTSVFSENNANYCKSRNFGENVIFANRVKRHICDIRNSRVGHDLPISAKERVVAPFPEDSIFTIR